jgi:glycosyltransferase involved in cell wall biosynthesis
LKGAARRLSSNKRFHILLPVLSEGDAIGNDVFLMRESLVGAGHETHLYAESTIGEIEGVHRPEDLADVLTPEETLIYHFGTGWDKGLDILRASRARRAVKFHNITPAEYFLPYSREYFDACMHGRGQVRDIATMGLDLYMSDSGYNSEELVAAGAPADKCVVVPPFNDIERTAGQEADLDVVERYMDGKTNILMVGRVVPNKGHKKLIEVFSYYHRSLNPNSRLIIAGSMDPRLRLYADEVQSLAGLLGVADSVVFTGMVSAAALKAFYLVSHAMLMTSYHEGFCVPLAEAMYFKLPIVAYGSSAIPGTLEGSAVYWEGDDPYYYALSLDEIISNPGQARRLADIQHRRFMDEYSRDAIKRKFLEAVA